ncbi:alpha/beta fold hydrolase, partial [Ruegeria arenilitoris]|uniref:alpha/beta fold hydrolase n=1 Tax=Ruegeria arenilitoris TaxID=1173585 RepID=UPI001C2BDE8B
QKLRNRPACLKTSSSDKTALGAQSRTFYQITTRAAHSLIPSSQLRVIENARHLFPVQKPEEFCIAVLDYLKHDVPAETR